MPTYEIDKSGNLLIDSVSGGSIEQIIQEHQSANGLLVAAVKAQADADAADKAQALVDLATNLKGVFDPAMAEKDKTLADLATSHASDIAAKDAIAASTIQAAQDAANAQVVEMATRVTKLAQEFAALTQEAKGAVDAAQKAKAIADAEEALAKLKGG